MSTAVHEGNASSERLGADGEAHDVPAGETDTFEDPHKPPPSAVVHVRGLSVAALGSDLVQTLQPFGAIKYVVIMPKKRQALVEFEDLESSRSCVNYSSTRPVYVCGQPAYCNFSTSQKILWPRSAEERQKRNHILLFTIFNPMYPITTDLLYTICHPCGPVHRIVIFRKNGLQAMVEFDSAASAQTAKSSLNGVDIYPGCCTLQVEFAKQTRLNVFKNDSETWDYTYPGVEQAYPSQQFGNISESWQQQNSRGKFPEFSRIRWIRLVPVKLVPCYWNWSPPPTTIPTQRMLQTLPLSGWHFRV